MSDFIRFSHPPMHMEAVQSLLEGKRLARSLEAAVDALIPVVDNPDTIKQLEEIREHAARASHQLQRLYNRNAKEAFGETPRTEGPPRRDSTTGTRRGDVADSGQAGSTQEAEGPGDNR